MIEQLTANGADEPLRGPVLPGALECRALGMETELLDDLGNRGREDRVIVVDQIPMDWSVGKGCAQLLAHPLSGWSGRDIEGKDAASPVIEYEPDVEELEPNGRDHEEVHSRDPIPMVLQERRPAVMLTRIGLDSR